MAGDEGVCRGKFSYGREWVNTERLGGKGRGGVLGIRGSIRESEDASSLSLQGAFTAKDTYANAILSKLSTPDLSLLHIISG